MRRRRRSFFRRSCCDYQFPSCCCSFSVTNFVLFAACPSFWFSGRAVHSLQAFRRSLHFCRSFLHLPSQVLTPANTHFETAMARMLGRSRSFRILKGGYKESHQRDANSTTPQPTLSDVEADRLKAATPVTRAESRVETHDPDMLQRPRTSSGPGDRSTLFHKKVIPVQSPDDSHFDVSYTSPSKSTTTLHSAQLSEQEGIIGIALGSPTMPPQHWQAPPTDFVTQNHGPVTQISSNKQSPGSIPRVHESQSEAPKPKISRWKSIFKKTSPPPRQNKDTFYQLAKAVGSARLDNQQDNDSLYSRSLAQEDDAAANASPTRTFKSDIRPSRNKQTGHLTPDTRPRVLAAGSSSGKVKSPLSRFALSPRPQIPTNSYAALPSVTVSGSSQTTSPQLPGGAPLLDVDIPTVHMERYSVMFSGLLQPQTTNASSSLLQRRQGAADKVKPLNELSVKVCNSLIRNFPAFNYKLRAMKASLKTDCIDEQHHPAYRQSPHPASSPSSPPQISAEHRHRTLSHIDHDLYNAQRLHPPSRHRN